MIGDDSASGVVSTLTVQLTELKRCHRDEIGALSQALEAPHGEILEDEVAPRLVDGRFDFNGAACAMRWGVFRGTSGRGGMGACTRPQGRAQR